MKARADDDFALAEAGEHHAEKFVVAFRRACEVIAGCRHDVELADVIDLAALSIAGFPDAADAQRSSDRQHQRIDHDRRRAASAKGKLCHVVPKRPGLGIEQVVAMRAQHIQRAGIDDDPAVDLGLAVEGMALTAHRELAAGLVGIGGDADDIVDRARPDNRDGQAAHAAAEIYTGEVAGGLIEQHLAVKRRQIPEGLGYRVPDPWCAQRADAAGERGRSGELDERAAAASDDDLPRSAHDDLPRRGRLRNGCRASPLPLRNGRVQPLRRLAPVALQNRIPVAAATPACRSKSPPRRCARRRCPRTSGSPARRDIRAPGRY